MPYGNIEPHECIVQRRVSLGLREAGVYHFGVDDALLDRGGALGVGHD